MPEEFETFKWKGQTRYRCGGRWESGAPCQYDTSDREAIVKHMATPHLREAPKAGPAVLPEPVVPASVSGTEERAAEFKDARFADVDSIESAE